MGMGERRAGLWLISAALVLAFAVSLTWLSSQFVFGENHAQRPIATYTIIYIIGWMGFACACVLAYRSAAAPLFAIVLVGLLTRCFLFPSSLVQENDCYRYVLDGQTLLHGVNPYAYSPEAIVEEAPPNFITQFEREDARIVLSRISYQHIPTIYPPLAQFSFAIGAALMPWNFMGQRLVFLLYDIATMAVLLLALRAAGKPPAWLVFYAWNPLILKEIANSAHSDSLAALCLALMLWLYAAMPPNPKLRWPVLSGLALAGAILARLYPVLLIPLCVAFLWKHTRSMRAPLTFGATMALAIVVAYLPFIGIGYEQLTEGLRTYGSDWRRNEGAFMLIDYLTQAAQTSAVSLAEGVVPRQSAIHWVNDYFPSSRHVAAGLVAMTALAAAARYLRSSGTFDDFVWALQVTLLTWLLLMPASYPWYAVTLIAISTLRPKPWLVVLSGAYGLYYLLFLYSYRDYPDAWPYSTKLIEHTLIWLAILIPWLLHTQRSRVK